MYYVFRLVKDGETDEKKLLYSDFPYSTENGLLNDDRIEAITDAGKTFKELNSVNRILAWVNANTQ